MLIMPCITSNPFSFSSFPPRLAPPPPPPALLPGQSSHWLPGLVSGVTTQYNKNSLGEWRGRRTISIHPPPESEFLPYIVFESMCTIQCDKHLLVILTHYRPQAIAPKYQKSSEAPPTSLTSLRWTTKFYFPSRSSLSVDLVKAGYFHPRQSRSPTPQPATLTWCVVELSPAQ